MSFRFGAANTDNINFGDIDLLNGGGSYSIVVMVRMTAADSSRRQIFSQIGSIGFKPDTFLEFTVGGTNVVGFGWRATDDTFPGVTWTSGFAAGTEHLLIAIWDGTTIWLYADQDPSAKASSTPGLSPKSYSGNTLSTWLGNNSGATTRSMAGDLGEVTIYPWALNARERWEIQRDRNPHALPGASFYVPLDRPPVVNLARGAAIASITGGALAPHFVLPTTRTRHHAKRAAAASAYPHLHYARMRAA